LLFLESALLRKWKVSNFKSVREKTVLEMAPVTVFAGANSSGKSSWIQSVLLLTQSLSNRSSAHPITLNGFLVKLGQFDDLRSHGSEEEAITLGLECEIPPDLTTDEPLYTIACDVTFDAPKNLPNSKLLQLQPSILSCKLHSVMVPPGDEAEVEAWFLVQRTTNEPVDISLKSLDVNQPTRQTARDASKEPNIYSITFDEETLNELREEMAEATPLGCRLRQFLPTSIIVSFDLREEEARVLTSALCDGLRSRSRLVEDVMLPESVADLIRQKIPDIDRELATNSPPLISVASSAKQWLDQLRRLPPSRRFDLRRKMSRYRQEIHDAFIAQASPQYGTAEIPVENEPLENSIRYLRLYFSNLIKYLGPLRDEPKPLYPLAPTADPFDVGLRGEHTAAILHIHKHKQLQYVPSSSFFSATINASNIPATLEGAVLDWLRYMEIAEKISTEDLGKLGHDMRIVDSVSGVAVDLTHVGVGVSQVLPILVMCLLAREGSTIILEQPELHLHPSVQSKLADFFLSLALSGKQCILETHSEYIVNRLRLRAATAFEDSISSLLRLYFVEKAKGASVYRDVSINKFGAIPEWPKGFFDQTHKEIEDILLAAARKLESEEDDGLNAARKA
jgi:predicted ATPase